MSRSTTEVLTAGLNSAAAARPILRRIAWIVSRHRLRRHIKGLMTLDDRTLRDIGLGRGEIEHAGWHGWEFNCWHGRPLSDRR